MIFTCLQNGGGGRGKGEGENSPTQKSGGNTHVINSKHCVLYIASHKKQANILNFLFLFCFQYLLRMPPGLVPEKVRNLVSYNEIWMKSFTVNWTPPAGDWEHYRIVLFNESLVLLNTTVGKEETHYALDGLELIPGRQYEIEVIVESGNLRNSERCQGRTGKSNLIGRT
jgi:hypothetical protein